MNSSDEHDRCFVRTSHEAANKIFKRFCMLSKQLNDRVTSFSFACCHQYSSAHDTKKGACFQYLQLVLCLHKYGTKISRIGFSHFFALEEMRETE